MKRIIYTVATLCSLGFMTACNNNSHSNEDSKTVDSTAGVFHKDSVEKAQAVNDDKKMDSDESKFITEIASGGLMEVDIAKIAEGKAQSPAVKTLAEHMLKDHTKINEEVKELAAKKQITISSSMSDSNKETLEKIAKKNGADFDKEYVEQMVKVHKNDIDKFETAAKDSKDNEVKEWAQKTLPTLRHHLEMAEKLKK
jgi:putative membrane protein